LKDTITSKTEKGFTGTAAETAAEKVAHAISVVGNPLFVALPLFLLVAWKTAPDLPHALLWWIITAGGVTGIPFFFIRRGVKRGTYTDDHVSVREQRLVPLAVGLGGMILVFLLLVLLGAARPYIASLTSALVSLAVALAITQLAKYKVSLHMVGVTGSVTVCSLLFSPWFLLLSPLILLLGWARWQVRAHTVLQACLGVLVAVIVTWAMLWLFGVLP
jgi:hypothetical protein